MAKNRKAAEQFIIDSIGKIVKGNFNTDRYKKYFASLSDVDFDYFMASLKNGSKFLTIQLPNFSESDITVENNVKVASQLGLDFFQRIWMGPTSDMPRYLTPVKYMVIDLPVRRASQMLIKGISVAEHNRTTDMYTGQVAGDSKTSKISFPELQVAAAMNLDNSMVELIKYRGGDIKGGYALDAMLKKYGHASIATLSKYASGVESTDTLKTFLNCCHLKNNL